MIKSLQPDAKPYEVRDTQLKGFLLRVQPTGGMSYYAEYGRGKRLRIGPVDAMPPVAARAEAKKILGQAYSGQDPGNAKKQERAHTLGTFIEEIYKPWCEVNVRTSYRTLRRLKGSFKEYQSKKLHEITPWIVEKWRSAKLKSGNKPATVNRDLDDLKSLLAKAVEWGFIDTHPIAKIKRSKVDHNPIARYLTADERQRLFHMLDEREERIRLSRKSGNAWRRARGYPEYPHLVTRAFADRLKPLVIISLNTGMRRGELFNLRWEDVNFAQAHVTVRGVHAKSNQTRHIPLNDAALDAFERWRDVGDDWDGLVFPGEEGKPLDNVNRSWRNVLKAAGIKHFRWHDMRHDFASQLVMSGIDLNTVRELLGHADLQMTLRYSHLAPEHKAAAVAKLGALGVG